MRCGEYLLYVTHFLGLYRMQRKQDFSPRWLSLYQILEPLLSHHSALLGPTWLLGSRSVLPGIDRDCRWQTFNIRRLRNMVDR